MTFFSETITSPGYSVNQIEIKLRPSWLKLQPCARSLLLAHHGVRGRARGASWRAGEMPGWGCSAHLPSYISLARSLYILSSCCIPPPGGRSPFVYIVQLDVTLPRTRASSITVRTPGPSQNVSDNWRTIASLVIVPCAQDAAREKGRSVVDRIDYCGPLQNATSKVLDQ